MAAPSPAKAIAIPLGIKQNFVQTFTPDTSDPILPSRRQTLDITSCEHEHDLDPPSSVPSPNEMTEKRRLVPRRMVAPLPPSPAPSAMQAFPDPRFGSGAIFEAGKLGVEPGQGLGLGLAREDEMRRIMSSNGRRRSLQVVDGERQRDQMGRGKIEAFINRVATGTETESKLKAAYQGSENHSSSIISDTTALLTHMIPTSSSSLARTIPSTSALARSRSQTQSSTSPPGDHEWYTPPTTTTMLTTSHVLGMAGSGRSTIDSISATDRNARDGMRMRAGLCGVLPPVERKAAPSPTEEELRRAPVKGMPSVFQGLSSKRDELHGRSIVPASALQTRQVEHSMEHSEMNEMVTKHAGDGGRDVQQEQEEQAVVVHITDVAGLEAGAAPAASVHEHVKHDCVDEVVFAHAQDVDREQGIEVQMLPVIDEVRHARLSESGEDARLGQLTRNPEILQTGVTIIPDDSIRTNQPQAAKQTNRPPLAVRGQRYHMGHAPMHTASDVVGRVMSRSQGRRIANEDVIEGFISSGEESRNPLPTATEGEAYEPVTVTIAVTTPTPDLTPSAEVPEHGFSPSETGRSRCASSDGNNTSSDLADSTSTTAPTPTPSRPNSVSGRTAVLGGNRRDSHRTRGTNTLIVEEVAFDMISPGSSPWYPHSARSYGSAFANGVQVHVAVLARRESGTLVVPPSIQPGLDVVGDATTGRLGAGGGRPDGSYITVNPDLPQILSGSRIDTGTVDVQSVGSDLEASLSVSDTDTSVGTSSGMAPSVIVSTPTSEGIQDDSTPSDMTSSTNLWTASAADSLRSLPYMTSLEAIRGNQQAGWKALARATSGLVMDTHSRWRKFSGVQASSYEHRGDRTGSPRPASVDCSSTRRGSGASAHTNSSITSGETRSDKAEGSGASAGSLIAIGDARDRDLWKLDDHAASCDYPRCPIVFSYRQRRHHCRACGEIFCENHSAYGLPLFYPPSASKQAAKGAVKMSRVCVTCDQKLRHPDRAFNPHKAAYTTGSDTTGKVNGFLGVEAVVSKNNTRRLFSAPTSPMSTSPEARIASLPPRSSMEREKSWEQSNGFGSKARPTCRSVSTRGAILNPRMRHGGRKLAKQNSLPPIPSADLDTPRAVASPSSDVFTAGNLGLASLGYFPRLSVPYLPGEEPAEAVDGILSEYPLANKHTRSPSRYGTSTVGSTSSLASLDPLDSSGGSSSRSASRRPQYRIEDMPSEFGARLHGKHPLTPNSSGLLTPETEFIPEAWGFPGAAFDPDAASSDDEGPSGLYARGRKQRSQSQMVVDGGIRYRLDTHDAQKDAELLASSPAWATF